MQVKKIFSPELGIKLMSPKSRIPANIKTPKGGKKLRSPRKKKNRSIKIYVSFWLDNAIRYCYLPNVGFIIMFEKLKEILDNRIKFYCLSYLFVIHIPYFIAKLNLILKKKKSFPWYDIIMQKILTF